MEKIWYEDIRVLFNKNISSIIPLSSMNSNEQHNASMRFAIMFSILVYIFSNGNNKNIFIIPLFVSMITLISKKYDTYEKELKKESYRNQYDDNNNNSYDDSEDCVVPTKENPFMNVMMNEYNDNPNRSKACSHNKKIKNEMKDIYFEKTFRDINDIFNTDSSFRQYYTMPNTKIPNDQNTFAKELYGIKGKTCKEGNGDQCKYYADNI